MFNKSRLIFWNQSPSKKTVDANEFHVLLRDSQVVQRHSIPDLCELAQK